jgi:methyl-accepting chemotaxis protein
MMMPIKLKMNIRNRLILGFAALTFVLAVAVSTTLWKVSGVESDTTRIVQLRVPTAFASSGMVTDINASLATLRGWMLTGNEDFKTQRAAVWADIHKIRAEMDRLSASWTNPKNVEVWSEFKTVLDEFEKAQAQVEAIANSPEEHPANQILFSEAAPRASVIIKSITQMIDTEAKLPATPERKALLGMMADVRGTMGMGLANIRAYLLSGDEKFKETFETFWAKNEKRFTDLSSNAYLFSPEQKTAFESLSAARGEFAPLPAQMFAIRGSNKWNMANYLLVTEAAPRAGKLLTILSGARGEDGTRSGGMVDNQKRLLADDANFMAEDTRLLKTIEWFLLAVGLAVAVVITFRSSFCRAPIMVVTFSPVCEGSGATARAMRFTERILAISARRSLVRPSSSITVRRPARRKDVNSLRASSGPAAPFAVVGPPLAGMPAFAESCGSWSRGSSPCSRISLVIVGSCPGLRLVMVLVWLLDVQASGRNFTIR